MNDDDINDLPDTGAVSGDNKQPAGKGFAAPLRSDFDDGGSRKGLWLLIGLIVIGLAGGGYFYLIGMEEEIPAPSAPVEAAAPAPVPGSETPTNITEAAQPPAGAAPAPVPAVSTGMQEANNILDATGTAPASATTATASAATPSPVAETPVTPDPSTPSGAVPAPTEVTPAPVTADNAVVQPQPAQPAPDGTGAAPTGQPSAVNTPAPDSLPAPPDQAELAIVQNAAVLDTLSPTPPVSGTVGAPGQGPRVSDMLPQAADIRNLPPRYLVVKKNRNADSADSRLQAARSALSQGRNQAAFELFDELSQQNPGDKRGLMGRAVALQKMGQTSEALAAYEEVLQGDPKNIEALTNMLGLLKDQDADTAVEKLRQLRDVYPSNSDITAQLGMVYGMAGDYDQALKYLEMADALKPGNASILYNRAVVYDRMGNSVRAAELYRQIISLVGEGSLDQNFPLDAVRKRLAVMR